MIDIVWKLRQFLYPEQHFDPGVVPQKLEEVLNFRDRETPPDDLPATARAATELTERWSEEECSRFAKEAGACFGDPETGLPAIYDQVVKFIDGTTSPRKVATAFVAQMLVPRSHRQQNGYENEKRVVVGILKACTAAASFFIVLSLLLDNHSWIPGVVGAIVLAIGCVAAWLPGRLRAWGRLKKRRRKIREVFG